MKVEIKRWRAVVSFPEGVQEYIVYDRYASNAERTLRRGLVANPNKNTSVHHPLGRIREFGGKLRSLTEMPDFQSKLLADNAPSRETRG